MENLYCCGAFFLSIIFIIITKRALYRPSRNSPPGPFSLPIIGHFHLLKDPLYQTLQSLSFQYGPVMSLKFGSRPVVVVSSPSAIEECFTKNDIIFANRPRSMASDILTNLTYPAWVPYGPLWRNLRRILNIEVFSKNNLQKFSIIREQEVYSLVRLVFKVSNGLEPQKVNCKYFFSLLTFNVIMRMLTGEQCVGEEVASTDLGKQQHKDMKGMFFAFLSMNICDYIPILRWVGYKGLEKNMVRLRRKRDIYLCQLIENIEQIKKSPLNTKKGTLIESLLSLHESESEFKSDDIIKSIVLTMFSAGTDTTAITMEWSMTLLLNHPEVLQKVKVEIENQVGHGRLLNDSDLANLPYLRCVINETLRLYPPTPLLLPHFSTDDCTVEGYTIPKGTMLIANAWAVHRHPKLWEEPDRFKPERFKGFNGERDASKFFPFGIGRRACPGAGMGQRLDALALGVLIQCFDWERLGKEMVEMKPSLGFLLGKAKPLEALCSPCNSMKSILSEL